MGRLFSLREGARSEAAGPLPGSLEAIGRAFPNQEAFADQHLGVTLALMITPSFAQRVAGFPRLSPLTLSEDWFRVGPTPKWTLVSYAPERCVNNQPCQLKERLTSCVENEY